MQLSRHLQMALGNSENRSLSFVIIQAVVQPDAQAITSGFKKPPGVYFQEEIRPPGKESILKMKKKKNPTKPCLLFHFAACIWTPSCVCELPTYAWWQAESTLLMAGAFSTVPFSCCRPHHWGSGHQIHCTGQLLKGSGPKVLGPWWGVPFLPVLAKSCSRRYYGAV